MLLQQARGADTDKAALAACVTELEAALAASSADNKTLTSQLAAMTSTHAALEADLAATRTAMTSAAAAHDDARRAAAVAHDASVSETTAVQAELVRAQTEADALLRENSMLKEAVSAAQQREVTLQATVDSITAERDALRTDMQDARAQVCDLA